MNDNIGDWRTLIHGLVEAHWRDQRLYHETVLIGAEAGYLGQHAAESMNNLHTLAAKASCESLGQPDLAANYELVEESSEHLHVFVPCYRDTVAGRKSVPFMPTRVLLTHGESSWQISALLQPCISCNLRICRAVSELPIRTPGKCFFCNGTGQMPSAEVQGLWPFRRRRLVRVHCKYCEGIGTCKDCRDESTPGWRTVVSLAGLRPATKQVD